MKALKNVIFIHKSSSQIQKQFSVQSTFMTASHLWRNSPPAGAGVPAHSTAWGQRRGQRPASLRSHQGALWLPAGSTRPWRGTPPETSPDSRSPEGNVTFNQVSTVVKYVCSVREIQHCWFRDIFLSFFSFKNVTKLCR